MITKYEEQFYYDIHKVAIELTELVNKIPNYIPQQITYDPYITQEDLDVIKILKKHPYLDLSNLPDYTGDYKSYNEDYNIGWNTLNEEEFNTILKWQHSLQK